jgi:hypothetical protein
MRITLTGFDNSHEQQIMADALMRELDLDHEVGQKDEDALEHHQKQSRWEQENRQELDIPDAMRELD